MPVRLGGLGLGNSCLEASREYASSVKVTTPLVTQLHQLPENPLIKSAQQEVRSERLKEIEDRAERIKEIDGTTEDSASVRPGGGKRIIGHGLQ